MILSRLLLTNAFDLSQVVNCSWWSGPYSRDYGRREDKVMEERVNIDSSLLMKNGFLPKAMSSSKARRKVSPRKR